jgi:iron-sulfur cluster repair protein YtfE (RIC family)
MTDACGCQGHGSRGLGIGRKDAGARAAQTVAEVSKDPRALDTLKRLGINHCCGAHLSLAEAAAAAGVPLAELLQALDEEVATR